MASPPRLLVRKLSEAATVPTRGSALSAGYDLYAAYAVQVPARGKALVKTDLAIQCPADTYGRVAPRSGLAWKHHIDVGAGVIDADYTGNVGVVLFNHSAADFEVKPGDRVAQLVLERIAMVPIVEVSALDETTRGAGGFGSTGVAAADSETPAPQTAASSPELKKQKVGLVLDDDSVKEYASATLLSAIETLDVNDETRASMKARVLRMDGPVLAVARSHALQAQDSASMLHKSLAALV